MQLHSEFCRIITELRISDWQIITYCFTWNTHYLISISGVHNLLDIFGANKYPPGVSRVSNRPTAFNVTSSASLYTPLANVYPSVFPSDFSIIFTVNISSGRTGYLLTMSDIMGKQRLAIMYGKKLRFEYYDQNGLPGGKSPLFDVIVSDSRWHQIALSVKGKEIKLYYDCNESITMAFRRSKNSYFGTNLMISLGPYFARYGNPFLVSIKIILVYEILAHAFVAKRQYSLEP